MTKPILLLLYLFLGTQLCAQVQKEIDKILNEYTNDSTPGIAVGVVQDGKIIYESYLGLSNLTYGVKVSEKTRFNIASTSKQFTALMILDLSRQGKLSLEDDIRKYLPELYPEVKEDIKIRHLLNHTSGIRDYVELLDLKDQVWWKQVGLDNGDILDLLGKQNDLAFAPGSSYTYSNSGYVVLAEIIAKVSDQKFTNYSKAFFQKLGMNETNFLERYMGVIPNRAEPYSDWGYGEWFQSPVVTKTAGEGFIYTTLKDQLLYEQKLQTESDKNSLLASSQKPIPNSETTIYGFGLNLYEWEGRTAVHHDGGTYGFNSQMIRFTDENLAVFVMSNNGNLRSDLIADEVASTFLPDLQEQSTNYDEMYYQEKKSILNIEGLYIGSEGSFYQISQDDEKTYWKKNSGNQIEIFAEGAGQYAMSYDSSMKIRFYEDEMILFWSFGKTKVYKKDKSSKASSEEFQTYVGEYFSKELDIGFEIILTEHKELKFSYLGEEDQYAIELIDRDHFMTENFVVKTIRDPFDRIVSARVSYGRAKNMEFKKKTNLKFQPKIALEEGSIQVSTIGSDKKEGSDILLTLNDEAGNEIWFKKFGGKAYDKASSILATDDGYLIIGHTSSYGNGNYDILLIKTDKEGKKQWQKTYGRQFNEYGYVVEETKDGYLIKGSIQNCSSNDLLTADCTTKLWLIKTDKNGVQLTEKTMEELEY